jgi:hypothetical protein
MVALVGGATACEVVFNSASEMLFATTSSTVIYAKFRSKQTRPAFATSGLTVRNVL